MQAQGYHHATHSGGSICKATYSGRSMCERGLAVHESQDCRYRAIIMLLILMEVSCKSKTATDCRQSATYSGESICESDLSMTVTEYRYRAITMLVEVCVKVSKTARDCCYHHATYSHRATDCSQSSYLHILVEVSVKVACLSTHCSYHHAT